MEITEIKAGGSYVITAPDIFTTERAKEVHTALMNAFEGKLDPLPNFVVLYGSQYKRADFRRDV